MTRMLKKALESVLSEKDSKELVSAFDQIGDIIIVRIPESNSKISISSIITSRR